MSKRHSPLRISILLSLLILSFETRADDWTRIDQHVANASLCEAFPDSQSSNFQRRSCSIMGCDQWTYQVKTTCQAANGQPETATIDHMSNGRITSRSTITQNRWTEIHGNLFRLFAANVTSFGNEFKLSSVEILGDGSLKAKYQVFNYGNEIESGHWIFGKGPAIPQVIERYQKRIGIITEENTDTLL